jgi:ribosomal protein S21
VLEMGLKIRIQDNENIDAALARFRRKEQYEYKRWTKKRYGYYEKPSILKRKRKKMAKIWASILTSKIGYNRKNSLHLYIGLKELFARTGPNNSAGY